MSCCSVINHNMLLKDIVKSQDSLKQKLYNVIVDFMASFPALDPKGNVYLILNRSDSVTAFNVDRFRVSNFEDSVECFVGHNVSEIDLEECYDSISVEGFIALAQWLGIDII